MSDGVTCLTGHSGGAGGGLTSYALVCISVFAITKIPLQVLLARVNFLIFLAPLKGI